MSKQLKRDAPRILVMEAGLLASGSRAVVRSGGIPLPVSPRDLLAVDEALAHRFHGLLLMGGGDVDPRLYGEKPQKQVYGVSEERDYCEWQALDRAEELGIPVLGICRGSQLMAIHNGGRLKQHVGGHRGLDHPVLAEDGSMFGAVLGRDRATFVSLHHQVVLRHGSGFRVAARDRTGLIEAIESKDGRCLGVQFHPEMDFGRNEASRRIFAWLTLEASRRAGLPTPKPERRAPTRPKKARKGKQLSLLADAPKPRRKPVQRGVVVSHVCRECGLRFDEKQDRDDHEYWICGDPKIRTTEPPPGHPDWM